MNNFIVAPNSIVEKNVSIGEGTKIWYFCHIREEAKIGQNCNIGDDVYIDKGVVIGDDCKIANKVSIYQGVIIKDRIFVGNGVVFTNVRYPKAKKKAKDYLYTIVEDDVTIDANATIVAGVKIGKGAMIGAGAIIIQNVPPFAFVAGRKAGIVKTKNYESENT